MEKKNICRLLLIGSIVFLLKANPILASDYQAIPTPANLGLSPTASGFLISWSSGAIDAVHKIYWGTDASVNEVNYAGIVATGNTAYENAGLVPGGGHTTTELWRVVANVANYQAWFRTHSAPPLVRSTHSPAQIHEHNPVRDAEKPREQGREGDRELDKIKILRPEQLKTMLAKTTGRKYKTMFMFAGLTGVRQGELLGLKLDDIDWKRKQVHVQRTFTKGQFFTRKTNASKRRIDLGPTLISELRKWKLASPKNDLNLVFANEKGHPMSYSNMVNRHFSPALKKAGIVRKLENGKIEGKIRFHDLRRTYAGIMIEQGENIKYTQRQLRHSSPTVTLNVYAHLMKPTNQEAVCRLEDTVLKVTGHNLVTKTRKGL